jgi:hypothetical protein
MDSTTPRRLMHLCPGKPLSNQRCDDSVPAAEKSVGAGQFASKSVIGHFLRYQVV